MAVAQKTQSFVVGAAGAGARMQLARRPNDQKNDKSGDQKIDHRVDKLPVRNDRSRGSLGGRESRIVLGRSD